MLEVVYRFNHEVHEDIEVFLHCLHVLHGKKIYHSQNIFPSWHHVFVRYIGRDKAELAVYTLQ